MSKKWTYRGLTGVVLKTSLVSLLVFVFFTSISVSAITRGYQTDDDQLTTGMVVAISQNSNGAVKVERASYDSSRGIVGVAIQPDTSLVTVAPGDEQIYVENDGEVNAYVTDLNGEVKEGDLLGLSPLKGILMKVSSADPALAIATEDAPSGGSQRHEVEGAENGEASISLTTVNLDQKAVNNLIVLRSDSSLERLGRSIVGKDVGELRVAIALLIFLLVMVVEGGIIYGAISSAILSLGRNPLAKRTIHKEFLRVIVVIISVLGFGALTIYAVLWV